MRRKIFVIMKPIEKAVSARRLQGEEAEYFLYRYI